jgi:uncharacterized membrane protein YcaP (DUF421 family)
MGRPVLQPGSHDEEERSMDLGRLWTSWQEVGLVLLSTVSIYLSVIVYTRIAGLRSLATMSSFDFAATVAVGSTIATVANLGTPTAHGLLVLGTLYALQAAIAWSRRTMNGRFIDNRPLVLMAGAEILHENLQVVRVTEWELMSQLRAHGVNRLDDVRAVIMESTGSISVLHGAQPLDPAVLAGVRGADRLSDAGSAGSRP